MANASDRARFFLEQSVPELQELLRKDIFTQDEISAIAKKRSDFEHIINARGAPASDYIRYVAYEQNVDALKKKRIRRLGVKNFGYNGQRRTFFIFQRATRKHPGDLRLWMQYLDYTRSVRAHKRVGRILTDVLRLHPTEPSLWILAAKYSADDQGEFNAARSYFQRGLRFCPKEKQLWLEHCRLEMRYIAKTMDNIEGLGGNPRVAVSATSSNGSTSQDGEAIGGNAEIDETTTPAIRTDKTALETLATTPALTGAIPIAIFDAAMQEFEDDAEFAEQLFDLITGFSHLTCCSKILKHIVHVLGRQVPAPAEWAICSFKLPLVGIETDSPKFPMALRHSLQLLRATIVQQRKTKTRFSIAEKAALALLPLALDDTIDEELQQVISNVLKQTVKIMGSTKAGDLINTLQANKQLVEARMLLKFALKQDFSNQVLRSKYEELETTG
ncbi:hypothetical protein BT63DRAFT_427134 [Microthyrium microscopicum]|uniref:U3 small nucleolar RNA-associated protein 6 N-terminal domain-containing protein n=1 Tax=Microthyrium microscopicum TaxID=703497 RepID=A0A6A6U343_9PEZI|nr:hypothetical protein BT63DRAFT_427134 [Microthyrium microscopicum]